MIRLAFALIAALIFTTAQAQTYATGKDPRGRAVPLKVAPDGSMVTTSGAAIITAGAPAFNVAVTTVSTPAISLTAGGIYRVACTGDVFFRTGSGTPVALITDAPIFGPAVEYLALTSTSTAFAFVTAIGTATCVGTLIASTP